MKIRIRQYSFEISAPFEAGHSLTIGEAQALNRLRAENIRNNFAQNVKDEADAMPEGEMIPPSIVERLQADIERYDAAYTFVERHEPMPRPSALELVTRLVAEEHVAEEARRLGLALDSAQHNTEVGLAMKLESIQTEARARVARQQKIVSAELKELLDD